MCNVNKYGSKSPNPCLIGICNSTRTMLSMSISFMLMAIKEKIFKIADD